MSTHGPAAGGTAVTLTGTGFSTATNVAFGSTPAASFVIVSDTEITCVSPAQSAGQENISVINPDGGSPGTSDNAYYATTATITGVSPSSGSYLGGTAVTVTGSGFSVGTDGVQLPSGGNGTSVVIVSDTELTFTTPAYTGGAAATDIFARNTGTLQYQSAPLPADVFTYTGFPAPTITSVSPNLGAATGGTPVAITGTNLNNGSTVTIGGVPATIVNYGDGDGTSINITTPAGTGGAKTVEVVANGGTVSLPSGYTYETNALAIFTLNGNSHLISTSFGGTTEQWFHTAGGFPTPVLTITGTLPTGYTFTDNGDGTALLQGTVVTGNVGTYNLVVHAVNAAGESTYAIVLTCDPPSPVADIVAVLPAVGTVPTSNSHIEIDKDMSISVGLDPSAQLTSSNTPTNVTAELKNGQGVVIPLLYTPTLTGNVISQQIVGSDLTPGFGYTLTYSWNNGESIGKFAGQVVIQCNF